MKKIMHLGMVIMLGTMLTWVACEPGAEEDPKPNSQNNNNNDQDTTGVVNNDTIPPASHDIDFNDLTNDLIIAGATKSSGNLPAISNPVDLKIDKDTIFLADGVKTRVRIRYPQDHLVGASFYLQVAGADDYLEVDFEEEEASDTIAVFYLEFDPTDWDLPLSFTINIVPEDDSGSPSDIIDIPVVIEETSDNQCDFQTGDIIWDWIYTIQNGDFYLGPMFPQTVSGTVAGCCDSDGNSYYGNCIGTASHAEVPYESVFMVRLEYVKFFNDGTVAGELSQFTRNVRPSESDFCGSMAGYTESNTHNSFSGQFTFNKGNCSIQIESLDGETAPLYTSDGTYLGDFPLPIYVGSGSNVKYEIISPHFIKEIRGVEGISLERMYEARNTSYEWVD